MMRLAGGVRWFVAQTQPNREAWAQENLRRQGFETFCPKMRAIRRRQGRPISVLTATFPGYVFVKFHPHRDRWRSINGTFGVRGLVGADSSQPDVVPDAIMDQLMKRCEAGSDVIVPATLRNGDRVCFASGPFAGSMATVEKLGSGERVRLLLEILGSAQAVDAPADWLVSADS